MSLEPGTIFVWVVATGMALWLIIPVVSGLRDLMAQHIEEAKADGEPVSTAYKRMGDGCVGMLIKAVILIVALAIIGTALSVVSHLFSGPNGPEYEGWRR